MENFGRYVLGAVVALVAVLALFLASRAHTIGLHFGALVVFAWGVFFIGAMIKRHYDELESRLH